jgi:hypothetical protein
MHISIKEQTKDGKPAIMCVEKGIRVCIILSAKPAEAETFATLAGALGVDKILCLITRDKEEEFYAEGWLPSQEVSLVVKQLNGGKK